MTLIGPKTVFIILFITLGPVKLIGPFASLASSTDRRQKRNSALQVFALSTALVSATALVGRPIAWQWGISREAVMITTGIVYYTDNPSKRFALQIVGRRTEVRELDDWGNRTPCTKIVAIGLSGELNSSLLKSLFDECINRNGV